MGDTNAALAQAIKVSQSPISRITSGGRTSKMPELVLIANATDCTLSEVMGTSNNSRIEFLAHSSDGATMENMKQQLMHFMEIDRYLESYGI